MKLFHTLLLLVASASALCLASCHKETKEDVTQPLQQSFQAADPVVKQSIETASVGLRAKNYAEVAKALDPVLTHHNLTEPQKEALRLTFQQINRAVAADPRLDTKEMYELRAKMSKALTSGPRF